MSRKAKAASEVVVKPLTTLRFELDKLSRSDCGCKELMTALLEIASQLERLYRLLEIDKLGPRPGVHVD
jgi:hypothetical protein